MSDTDDLEKEAKKALLTAIRANADSASAEGLQQLATAYAMTIGAYRHSLPGVPK